MAWQFKSHEELTAAGYTYRSTGRCSSKKCRARIHWYTTPNHAALPIDPVTYLPHFATCPAYAAARESAHRVLKFPTGQARQRNLFEGLE